MSLPAPRASYGIRRAGTPMHPMSFASFSTYTSLFHSPGTRSFFIAALIARFPLAMMTLGIVIMLNHARGDYAMASWVASVCLLANALLAPQLSRLADRHGQARVTLPAAALASLAFCLLLAAYRLQWPLWTWFACAAGIGLMPNFGALSRARWSHLHSGTPLLRTAFTLESLCEEMVWMSGPIIVVWCCTKIAPEAGVAAAVLLFATGAWVFCHQKHTEPPPAASSRHSFGKKRPALMQRAVWLPCLTLLAFGGFFGVLEVATTAFAKQAGVPEKTFYPLTAYAIGSLITGSTYGLVQWKLPLLRQLLLVATVFALTTLPFFFIDSIVTLTVVCFIAGATCSPSIIIALALVESLADKPRLTESMTWALVSPTVGMAGGFALAGNWVDRWGAQPAFYGTVLFGGATFTVALLAQGLLRER